MHAPAFPVIAIFGLFVIFIGVAILIESLQPASVVTINSGLNNPPDLYE